MTLKSPNLKQTVSTLPLVSLPSSHLHFIFVKYDLILIVKYDDTLTLVSSTEPDFSGVDRGPGLHQGRTSIPAFQVVLLLLLLAFVACGPLVVSRWLSFFVSCLGFHIAVLLLLLSGGYPLFVTCIVVVVFVVVVVVVQVSSLLLFCQFHGCRC